MPDDGEKRNPNVHSMDFANAETDVTYTAGLLYVLGDGLIGAFEQDVGTSGQAESDTFINGENGAFVYKAEKIILPKVTGGTVDFAKADKIYYDAAGASNKLTNVTTANTACGVALEAVGTTDTQVLVELDGEGT